MTCLLRRRFDCFWFMPVLLVLVCASPGAFAQSSGDMIPTQPPVNLHFPGDAAGVNPLDGPEAMRHLRQLNIARQKAMVSDAAKLLALARELNDDLTAKKGGLSAAEQMKKIAEIERLAHSVKEKMSYVEGVAVNPQGNWMNSWPQ